MTRILDTVTPSLTHPLVAEAAALARTYADASADVILRFALLERFRGEVAVVSSFGAESAVLLHLVAMVAPDTPVLFLDTDRHFFQTLSYRKALAAKLGLNRVVDLHPDAAEVAEQDPKGNLSSTHPDGCCDLR
ncbi:MAG: phosphoadenosine phosphosulfate reductase family protein, partial [Asticcacaulis sp.]